MIIGLALLAGNSKPIKQTKSNGYQMLRTSSKVAWCLFDQDRDYW